MDTIIYDKIDEVQGKVEYNGGGINALKQDTAALLAKGVVKSVQRGVREIVADGTISIPISNVNTNKSLAIIETNAAVDAYNNGADAPLTHVLESNKIKVEVDQHYNDIYLSWQVIEFY